MGVVWYTTRERHVPTSIHGDVTFDLSVNHHKRQLQPTDDQWGLANAAVTR